MKRNILTSTVSVRRHYTQMSALKHSFCLREHLAEVVCAYDKSTTEGKQYH